MRSLVTMPVTKHAAFRLQSCFPLVELLPDNVLNILPNSSFGKRLVTRDMIIVGSQFWICLVVVGVCLFCYGLWGSMCLGRCSFDVFTICFIECSTNQLWVSRGCRDMATLSFGRTLLSLVFDRSFTRSPPARSRSLASRSLPLARSLLARSPLARSLAPRSLARSPLARSLDALHRSHASRSPVARSLAPSLARGERGGESAWRSPGFARRPLSSEAAADALEVCLRCV